MPASRTATLRVHIFARAPIAGQCKTRLMPRLGARGAAWVQRRLVERVLTTVCAAVNADRITLWGAPDAAHSFFARCRQRYGVRLATQTEGDLGIRMAHALRSAPGVLIGSDAFGLSTADVLAALDGLGRSDYVLLPATDGGYVLMGARTPLPSLAGVCWSTGRECAQTARRLRRRGSLAVLAPARTDFDSPADWRRARRAGLLKPLTQGAPLPLSAQAC